MGIVTTDASKRWSNHEVPYMIDETSFPANTPMRQEIESAIATWNAQVELQLVPRDPARHPDYVNFRESSFRCSSPVGRQGGSQNIMCDIGGSARAKIAGKTTSSAPAIATFKGLLRLVYLDVKKQNLLLSSFDGTSWSSSDVIAGQVSQTIPALTVFNNQLHMIYVAKDSRQLYHSIFNGSEWTKEVPIPAQKSKATPGLVVFNNQLHMVHLGESSNALWHSTFDGTRWTPNVLIPEQKSKDAPALAVYKNELVMVHLGNQSNQVVLNR
jgi:hypothetical protein